MRESNPSEPVPILSLYLGPLCNISERCYRLLLPRIRCPCSCMQSNLRNQKGFDGSLKEQTEEFLRNAKQDPEWIQNSLIQFVSYHNERAKRGEISVSTIPNYYRATKLFC